MRSPVPVGDLAAVLAGPVDDAARALLGCVVTAGGVAVRLTEVEAYGGLGADPASHAHRGRTPRNAVMFGPPGHLYVYFSYGMHWCGNVVTGPPGQAAAVLMRAGEVVSGRELARERRGAAVRDRELARGPARLMVALGLDRAVDGAALLDSAGLVSLSAPVVALEPAAVASGPRVGVGQGQETPWRFWIDGDPTVSAYRKAMPRPRRRPG
ncbi:DNA-3-methyladenine glycosylase [Micromonospora sp. NBC_01813]|uniref:DNA-3-methyladenine glycosylase n=1 Tax=Micromonospora sp. NBC_01813 TaxID=2975988 RepID=UPI002DD854AA|nr:DNA-3-methyladenine glycosylase [Micromonospora sp. NBC_01813]WSA10868.1 DNA-3-methyladenine glycosylase [Micromonospora sp. NBC_01813]